MSLDTLKRQLAIDQRNRILATVVSNSADTVRVRLPSGELRDAIKPDSSIAYTGGDLLEVITADGVTLSVDRTAPYRPPGGQVIKSV